MSAINWVGKENSTGRICRGGASAPVCETRWIVPIRPYRAPKGSIEQIENAVLMGAGIVAFVFGMIFIGMAGVV